MGNFWLSLLFTSICATSWAQDRISPGESNARLHGVTRDHAVWVTSELDPATTGQVAAKYTHRIYLQNFDETTAKLFHSFMGTNIGNCSASKSGTLIFSNSNSGLSWHASDGSIDYEPVLFGKFDLYSDGLVLHSRPDCYFVPFKNHRVDLASRATLTNAGTFPSLGLPVVDVVRHDGRLAWVGEKTTMKKLTTQPLNLPPERTQRERRKLQYAIYTYDIEKSQTTTTDLSVEWKEFRKARMFDGKLLLVAPFLIYDVETGELVKDANDVFRKHPMGDLKFFENGFMYYWHDEHLYAIDLMTADSLPIQMASMPRSWGCARSATGPVVWGGKAWTTLSWIRNSGPQTTPKQ